MVHRLSLLYAGFLGWQEDRRLIIRGVNTRAVEAVDGGMGAVCITKEWVSACKKK